MARRLISVSQRFIAGYYNLLLLFLILLFALRPYDRGPIYHNIWKLLLTAVLLSAIFNCNHNRLVKISASILAIPVVLLSWFSQLTQPVYPIFVLNATLTIFFMIICTCSIIYDVVLRARVTLETLKGVVCAYFMVAFAFAYIYFLIEYLAPNTFQFSNRAVLPTFFTQFLSEMLYFSFITLLTIGYGDITALKDIGQTATVIEGIFGQFYIAILVSRLVGVYSMYSNEKFLKDLEKDLVLAKKNIPPP